MLSSMITKRINMRFLVVAAATLICHKSCHAFITPQTLQSHKQLSSSCTWQSSPKILPQPTIPTSQNLLYSPKVPLPSLVRLSMASSSSLGSSSSVLALYEQVQSNLPSDKVIDACAAAGRQGERVIASDIAAQAGVSLGQAQRDLQLLASLAAGDIAVSSNGDLLYSFPSDLQGVLNQRSSQYKLQQQFQKAWPTLFWGIRVSFGVALVASLVAIYSTIFFISSSSSSSSDDDRGSNNRRGSMGGGGFGGSWFWGPSPFDFFYYRPYGYYGYYGADAPRRDPEELGFFESVYSYVFGDGNPNVQLEERRLKLAAEMIRSNQGAVTAEQLAPYCDPEITPEEAMKSNYVDESFVLPIVTQLGGEPKVTDDGDIVYVFPDLQTTASASSSSTKNRLAASSLSSDADGSAMILKRAGLSPNASARDIQLLLNYNGISTRGAYEKQDLIKILEKSLPPMSAEEQAELEKDVDYQDPTLLAEREIPFSVAKGFNKVLSAGLGIVNLVGALFLGGQLAQITAAGYTLPGVYGAIAAFYPLLLGYAVMFNAIPLVRNLWLQRQNADIQRRNGIRKKWRQALANGSSQLKRKLASAKQFGVKLRRLGSSKKDILYDTASTTIEDLGKQKEQLDLSAFDKLLQQDDDKKSSGSGTGSFE